MNRSPSRRFLGLPLDAVSPAQTLEWARERLREGRGAHLVTLNPDVVLKAVEAPGLRRAIQRADLVVADGIGVFLAARWLGISLRERVPGADLVLPLAELAAREGHPVYLVSARPGAAEGAGEILRQRYPDLILAGCRTVPFRALSEEEEEELAEAVRSSGARLLLAALGAGRQEPWIDAWSHRMEGVLAFGCGAALDFLVGQQRRAPGWARRMGLEWLHRLLHEPTRLWRRYLLRGPRFFLLVLRAKMGRVDSGNPDPVG